MDDLTAARHALTSLCHELLREDTADQSLRKLVEAALAKVEPAPFYVVAFGEYGRGKSTLLSALAGRRSIFPHEPTDTTSIVTTLTWAPTAEAEIAVGGIGSAPPHRATIQIDDVRQYVTEVANRGNEQCVLAVEMRAPLARLAPGLVLVDTPGVNSRNEAHNLATQQYLSRADVILFVASTDEPLSALELAVLGQAAGPGQQVVAVLAKADQGGADELAASASQRVSDELSRPVSVLPVSAIMALDAQDDHIQSLEDDSRLPELAARLAELQCVHQAHATLLARPPLVRAITLLADPCLKELSVLRKEMGEAESHDRALREIEALKAAAARFHGDLPGEVDRMIADISATIADRSYDLRQRVRTFRALPAPGMDPDAYFRGILNQLAEIANVADTRRAEFISHTVAAAKRLTEAELAPSAEADLLRSALRLPVTALSFGSQPGFSFAAVREGLTTGAKLATVTGSVGGLIGGTLASVPGAAAGLTVGALVGHVTGWIGGIRDAIRRARQDWQARNVQSMADIALDCIDQSARSMELAMRQSAPATVSDLRSQFDAAMGERLESLTLALRDTVPLSPGEAIFRADLIEAARQRIARYERMSHHLTGIVQRLEQIASAGPPVPPAINAATAGSPATNPQEGP
jgi:hypothetical protein